MTIPPVLQLKSSSNEAGEREGVSNKAFSGEAESLKRHSRDTLLYLTTCQIGHPVEVHLKNGSVYSGIFHAADVEKDFGIVLKMASLIAEGTLRGPKSRYEFFRKPPFKTFIIPADELVQVVAKDFSVSSDSMINAVENEKKMEMLTDSSISKSCHVNPERKLVPWVGDKDVPEQEQEALENVKGPRDRKWDQFKANELLFGVKSTFNEELYTTKLERGHQPRELEEEARRVATEIEGEVTQDLHVAEERGLQLNEKFDIDEETKYSAVCPVDGFDNSGLDKEDEKLLDTCKNETFGGSSTSDGQKPASDNGKGSQEIQERDLQLNENSDIDKETKYSADCPVDGIDDSGFDKEDEKLLDTFNNETFGGSSTSDGQKPAPDNGNSKQELQGDHQPSGSDTNVDKSCSESDVLPPKFDKKRYKDFSAMSKSQRDSPEVPQSNRSAEELVSGQGARKFVFGTIHMDEDVKFSGGATSEGKVVGESSLEQVASRSSESCPNSPIGSLSLSVETTPSPNAKVPDPKLNPREKSVQPLQPPGGVRPTSPISDASFYYPASSVQQMPVGHGDPMAYYQGNDPMAYYQGQDPMGYYQGHDPMAYYQGHDPMGYYQGHDPMGYYNHRPQPMGYYNHRPQPMEYYHLRQQNPQTYYPRNAQPQYPPRRQRQQMMPGHRRPPVVNTPPHSPPPS